MSTLRLKRVGGCLLAWLISLLLALLWLLIALWLASPFWLPLLAERVGKVEGLAVTLGQVSRPTLQGLDIGTIQVANESIAISIDKLEVGWHHADEDRLQLSLRAGRLDLYASRQLPSALEPLGADSSASAAAPPLAADSSTKNASPGQRLAELLAMPGGGRSSASRSDAAGPALALPFGLRLDAEVEIDTLQVMADVDEAAVVEPLGFFADTFTLEATGLGRGPSLVSLVVAGELSIPSIWRRHGDMGHAAAGRLSFELDQRIHLRAETSLDPRSIRMKVRSRPLQLDLVLEADDERKAADTAWRVHGEAVMTVAGLSPELMLPAVPPVFNEALPLQVDAATATLDVDLGLDDRLLPHAIQPAHAHFSAALQLDAGGPPGRVQWTQAFQLDRLADGLRLRSSPGILDFQPDAIWWRRHEWFAASGLHTNLLKTWRLKHQALTCEFENRLSIGQTQPNCDWPIRLTLHIGETAAALELSPALARQQPGPTAGGFDAHGEWLIALTASGEQLHASLPSNWSLNGRARVQGPEDSSSRPAWELDISEAALAFDTLRSPTLQIDSLNLAMPRLQLSIPQIPLADGSVVLQVDKTTGRGAAQLSLQLRSDALQSSAALPLTARFAVETLESQRTGSHDFQVDVETLAFAGLTTSSRLRVDPDGRYVSGPLRLSGQPDTALLNAHLGAALGDALPGLDVKPGTLLFKGVVALDLSAPTPAWSADGLLGLQRWQMISDKAALNNVMMSASLAVNERRLQIFTEGESLSTISSNLEVLGLPFPGAFAKLSADLSYGVGRSDGIESPIEGVVTVSQARVGAFLGEVSLARPLTLTLPLSRLDETEALHVPLRLRGIDLGALVALENEHIDATGTISGQLGLVYTGSSVQIPASAPGRLTADGTGRIRLKEAGQWQSMAGGNPQLLFAVGALGNFKYDSLKTSVIFDDDEWLQLGLELRGRNPDVMDARPIHYNLNVETNILSLLQSLEMTKNLSETLEQRLLKAYE